MMLSKELTTGDGRLMTLRDVAEIFRDVVGNSTPMSGKIQKLNDNRYSLTVGFKALDCETSRFVKTLKVYSLMTGKASDGSRVIDNVQSVSDPLQISELKSATSNNGRYVAKVNKHSTGKAEKHLLEIWDRSKLLKTIDTSELDEHGLICLSEGFSSLEWCTTGDQDKLVYTCHSKQQKHISFFKRENHTNEDHGGENEKPRGTEYLHRTNFGEGFENVEHVIVAALDVANNFKITTFELDGYSLAETRWLGDGNKIVSTAYEEGTRKLGLIYCNNRASKIVIYDLQSPEKDPILTLESETENRYSPRPTYKGDALLFLSNPIHGPHIHATTINMYYFQTNISEPLVDAISGLSQFFVKDLPQNCFTTDDKHLVFSTLSDHHCLNINMFSLETHSLSIIKFPANGITILDFRHDIILAVGSELNATPTLFVATIDPENVQAVVAWHQLEDCVHHDEVDYEPCLIKSNDSSGFDISAIMIKPNLRLLRQYLPYHMKDSTIVSESQLPTMVHVHGGPHSAFTLSYQAVLIFLVRLGLKVILINYVGSIGVSEEYSRSLCGRISERDVDDCLQVIRHFVDKGIIDPKKLIISGGSHSGFIACHLCAQEEFKFKCAIVRNPVVELYSLFGTSDIPDWALTESLGHMTYDRSSLVTRGELMKMYDVSAMPKCNNANVPTLMLLGSKDLRVPMFQGQRWIDNLNARGVKTMCKIYPCGHDLSTLPEVMADSSVTQAYWIFSNLQS